MKRTDSRCWLALRFFATLALLFSFIPCALISVITKLQYKKASTEGAKQLKGLLGYLQHRREAPEFANLPRGGRRWADCGAGSTSKEIQANCERLQSRHVVAFTWVINPNPDCLALVDQKDHKRFISDLTEGAIEGMFEAREMPVPAYSYIIHNRETEDGDAPHRLNPHSHIVLVGTYDNPIEGQLPYYMNKSQKKGEDHPDLFWKTAQAEMGHLMERYVGLDWQDRLDALIAERERVAQAAQEQQVEARLAEIVQGVDSATLQPDEPQPDFWGETEDGLLWRGWVATRSADAAHEVGLHWQADDLLANPDDTFEVLISDLDEDEAQLLKQQLLEKLERGPEPSVVALREAVADLYPEEHNLPTEELSQDEDEQDLPFDMDLSL